MKFPSRQQVNQQERRAQYLREKTAGASLADRVMRNEVGRRHKSSDQIAILRAEIVEIRALLRTFEEGYMRIGALEERINVTRQTPEELAIRSIGARP
jgi:hypothetical protein